MLKISYFKLMNYFKICFMLLCVLLIGCRSEVRDEIRYANEETRIALGYLEPPIQIKFRESGTIELTDALSYTVIVEINEIGEIRVIGQLPFEIRSYIYKKKLEALDENLGQKGGGKSPGLGPGH